MSLIGIDGDNATRITRFANYLRNLLPSNDVVVMEMAAKAIGHLALAGGTFTPEYVDFEVKRALEWLGGDRQEGRRHAAVSITKYIFFCIFCYLLMQCPTLTFYLYTGLDKKTNLGSSCVCVY